MALWIVRPVDIQGALFIPELNYHDGWKFIFRKKFCRIHNRPGQFAPCMARKVRGYLSSKCSANFLNLLIIHPCYKHFNLSDTVQARGNSWNRLGLLLFNSIFPTSEFVNLRLLWPPLWSSGQGFWLQIQRSRVRFPAPPDFLSGSGSGTGCTQPREPREVNWGATWIK